MKHTPTIKDSRAACSCRAWIAPTLQPGETPGAYTTRAYTDHLRHVASFGGDERAQATMFPAAPTEPIETDQRGLF